MQLKTILNRVLRHSTFVYVAERLVETVAGPTVEVQLRARANSGKCQGSCRISHAPSVSGFPFAETGFPGLSSTEGGGSQSRVEPDQRAGFFALAA